MPFASTALPALDLRSLAVLRAGVGLFLLIDALSRLAGAGLLYADIGLLPRRHLLDLLEPAQWSLYLINGSVPFASLLLLLQALAAAFLMFGRHTRGAALLSWLLLVSAAARNPLAVTPAEAYLLALLSWGLLLPWGRRWSLDGPAPVDAPEAEPVHRSVAASILGLHVLALPLLYALRTWLQPGAGATATATALVLAIAVAILLLAALPGLRGWPRRVALVLYMAGALAVAAWGDYGALPWLAAAASLVLLEPGSWQLLNRRTERRRWRLYVETPAGPVERRLQYLQEMLALRAIPVLAADSSARVLRLIQGGHHLVLIDRDDRAHLDVQALQLLLQMSPLTWPLRPLRAGAWAARRLDAWLPQGGATVNSTPVPVEPVRSRWLAAILIAIGAASLAAQASTLRDPGSEPAGALVAVLAPLALQHRWLDAGRTPDGDSRWLAVVGEQADGRLIDALSLRRDPEGSAPNYGPHQIALAPGLRGRLYAQRLADSRQTGPRLALAQRLCRRHADQLVRLRVVQVLSPSAQPQSAVAEQRVLLRHECIATNRDAGLP